jgi:ATP-binding cassette subfamily B multidrug efflux pump
LKGIRRAFGFIKPFTLLAIGAFISLILVNAANLVTPQLLKILIDKGISQKLMGTIVQIAVLLVVIALGRGIFNFLQGYWAERVSQGIAYEMRNRIFSKLQKLSFTYHDQSQTGKLMTRMTSDVELVKMFTGNGLLQLSSAFIMFFGTLAILFSMNWKLTLIFLGMLPVIGVLFSVFIKKVMPLSRTIQQKLGAVNTVLQENLAGIRIVKAFAREEFEIGRFEERNQDYKSENIKLVNAFSTFFPLAFFVANLASAIVIWVGGLMVIKESITLGELVAFTSYQGYFLMPVFMLGFIASSLSRAEASAERIFEILDAKSEVEDKPEAFILPPVVGQVTFKDVCFKYTGSESYVIEEASFTVEPNQTIAILGQTGSGKSSIINLIPRFYDVSSGQVFIDGIDVCDVTLDSLRRQIGMVLQETTLFAGTIRENIAYGKPEALMDEIILVAKAAQANEFINEMPEGYETIIGERGVGLSGGQKQRIAIARALLLQPRILIMDDSTSSVDSETEFLIQQALEELRKGRTTFVIAQRISTVRNADKILVMEDAKIAAQGTHQELMQTSELYAEILETQMGGHTELVASSEEVAL